MYKKISDENILNGSNFALFIGIPTAKEQAIGTIDGTNKEFKVKNPPIYPKNGASFLPINADVSAYLRKGTTDTAATLATAGVKTGTDTVTGDTIYNTIELQTAPATADVDGVYVDYVEEMQAMVNQGVDTTFDQETKDVTYLGSTNTLTSYGAISTSFKADLKCSESTLRQIQKMSFEEDSDQTGVDTGAKAYKPFAQPQSLYAYLNIKDESGDVIGRIYCESVKVPPVLPTVKTGDDASVSLEITVGETPRMILLDSV
jgi:hypothetical protein